MNNRTSLQVTTNTLKKVKAIAGLTGATADQVINELAEKELIDRGVNPETMRAINGKG